MPEHHKRLIEEYKELKDRLERLIAFIEKCRNGEVTELDCPLFMLVRQKICMQNYLDVLKARINVLKLDIKEG